MSAFAQENVIRVINPDGSEAVVELPPVDSYTIQTRTPGVPEKPAPVKVIEKSEDIPEVAATQKVVPPVDVPSRSIAPSRKPQTVSTFKTPPIAPKPKAKATPVPPKDTGMAQVVAPSVPEVSEDVVVTEKLAKRIALQIAPPSRDIKVMTRQYEGKNAYLVQFRTEEGYYDVLVDMVTGDILATKER